MKTLPPPVSKCLPHFGFVSATEIGVPKSPSSKLLGQVICSSVLLGLTERSPCPTQLTPPSCAPPAPCWARALPMPSTVRAWQAHSLPSAQPRATQRRLSSCALSASHWCLRHLRSPLSSARLQLEQRGLTPSLFFALSAWGMGHAHTEQRAARLDHLSQNRLLSN